MFPRGLRLNASAMRKHERGYCDIVAILLLFAFEETRGHANNPATGISIEISIIYRWQRYTA